MKKSNVTVIATILIALHVLAFAVMLGSCNDRKNTPKPTPPKVVTSEPAQEPAPTTVADFAVPELAIPVEVTEMAPAKAREAIAVPGTREGYLRNDRPNRRTSTVYPKLVGEPYRGAIVVDARTGKILYENRATTYCYPASVTKLMTMLIVLEQIDAGVVSLSDKVAITKEGISIRNSRPSQVFLDVRESGAFTVDDLLNAVMIHSACDASQVLAIHVAGSRKAFIDMMNQKARELGMNSTIYHTEHGLPPVDGSQSDISTPYDIALLCMAALRHPETLRYTGTKLTYLPLGPIRKDKFMLANRNILVGKAPYPGCDGLKTGYHSKGGFSLAATAKQDGQRVISVVLGASNRDARNASTRKLLDKGFDAVK